MTILPILTAQDNALLARPLTETQDQGTYVRCDHQGEGISYWRFLRSEDLVGVGKYKALTWVVVVVDGPGIPREGYPMVEESVPKDRPETSAEGMMFAVVVGGGNGSRGAKMAALVNFSRWLASQ